jgi:hypothetical protein
MMERVTQHPIFRVAYAFAAVFWLLLKTILMAMLFAFGIGLLGLTLWAMAGGLGAKTPPGESCDQPNPGCYDPVHP